LAKNINCYFKGDFRDQGVTLYSLRQVIEAGERFLVRVEPGFRASFLGLGSA
jgi:hypothetical protein